MAERTVTCKACGSDFTTTRCGKAAFYCRTPECDAARKAKGLRVTNTGLTVQQREERRRKAEEDRLRKASAKRLEAIRKRTRKRGLESFAPIFDDPDQMILYDELMEVMERAASTPAEKIEAKKALVKITHAESRAEQHDGWQQLAAVSLKMADRFRPRPNVETRVQRNDATLVTA